MTISSVPFENPDQSTISLVEAVSPYSLAWWTTQTIEEVPEDSVGWLVAQGWRITNIDHDDATDPPTSYYDMTRQSLQNWAILQSLLNNFTYAYNEARWANSVRYNQVVTDWTEMLASSQTQFNQQVTEQNAHVGVYLGNLTTYMDDLDTLVEANKTTLDAAITSSTALLANMQTEHDSFDSSFTDLLDLLLSDYNSHVTTATAFLTDLGTTELARINEAFDASLTEQNQKNLDNGFYASGISTDITARNTRDKDEQIQVLNDRLNREKWENQHRLYEQQRAMRDATMQGKSQIYRVALDVLRYRQAQTMSDARALATLRGQIITQQMSISMARLQGLQATNEQNQRLMAYQLDERNKLLIGLYGFVERREDIGPQFEQLAQICTSLGDSGGGWITP